MLDELDSYALSDLLLFSQETYFRLFELYNREIWPAQTAAAAVGLAMLVLARRPVRNGGRWASAVLAATWGWVAWAFHVDRYATINPWATYLGGLFLLEALLLLWTAIRPGAVEDRAPPAAIGRTGFALLVFGMLLQPFVGLAAGRAWTQLSMFAIGPDPTATVTLGAVLIYQPRRRWLLIILPLLWCLISTLTAVAMENIEGVGTAAVAMTAFIAAIFGGTTSSASPEAG